MDTGLYNSAVEGLVEVIYLYRDRLTSQITPTGNTVLHLHLGVPTNKGGIAKIQFIQTLLSYEESLLLQKNENGEIPLHLAARFGHTDAVEVLIRQAIARGCLTEMLLTTDKNKDTALHQAVRWNNHHIVELLVRADAHCQYDGNGDDETPLYIAAERNYSTLVATILDTCQSPTYGGPLGRTALHIAALLEDEGMLKKILEKDNLLLKSRDKDGKTPLFYGDIGAIALQYDNTSQSAVYIQDNEGRTVFHIAALYGCKSMLKTLIEHKPDCSEITDNKGQNIFHYAVNSGCELTLKYLMSSGICSKLINNKDQEGNTPLHLLATTLSYAPLSYFRCMKAFMEAENVDLMVFNSQNQTIVDIVDHLRFVSSRKFTPYQHEIVRDIYQVAPKDLRLPEPKIPDKLRLTSYDASLQTRNSTFKKTSEVHLIVATLIATVSFAAGLAIPGGFNQELGADQGTALLTRKTAFKAFMVSDALALTFSTASIVFYFHVVRLGEPQTVRRLFLLGMLATAISIGAMMVAFITSIYATIYHSPSLAAVIIAFPAIFVFFYVPDLLNSGLLVATALGIKLPKWIRRHPYRDFICAIGKAFTQCG